MILLRIVDSILLSWRMLVRSFPYVIIYLGLERIALGLWILIGRDALLAPSVQQVGI